MQLQSLFPSISFIIIGLIVMIRLMHYAKFYAPSYLFWIGTIISIIGSVSLFQPLSFLFILNRDIALVVLIVGVLICLASLLYPVKLTLSKTDNQKIDGLIPAFAFNEYHEVKISAPVEKVKEVMQITGVKDIPIAHFLMKIRGIADENVDMSDRAASNSSNSETISTPDFNFYNVSPDEWIAVMILKSSFISNDKQTPAPPEISSLEQFCSFNNPHYVKVAINFRFISLTNNETLLSTETRVNGITPKDSRIFGRYWRIIYPGSAIIRRVWLNTIKKRSESN